MCVQSAGLDAAASHVNYAGETPSLPVSIQQKFRTFALVSDAWLRLLAGYTLIEFWENQSC